MRKILLLAGVLAAATPVAAQETVKQQVEAAMGMGAVLAWPGCLRKLDRDSPGYDS